MSKKKKREFSVTEAVGDTSGFNSENTKLTSKRKSSIYIGLAGIVALIFIVIFFFVSPTKITFNYMNNKQNQSLTFEVDKNTGLLKDYPKDSDVFGSTYAQYFDFKGWYGNKNYTGVGLLSDTNDSERSLGKHQFNKFQSATLYAMWIPTEFKIDYNATGNIQNLAMQDALKKLAESINPTTYLIKHEPNDYEIAEYQKKLIKEDPDKYANSKQALQNMNLAIEEFKRYESLSTIKLENLTKSLLDKNGFKNLGYTFDGWYDEEGNQVTELDKLSPKHLKLTAKWTKNK